MIKEVDGWNDVGYYGKSLNDDDGEESRNNKTVPRRKLLTLGSGIEPGLR